LAVDVAASVIAQGYATPAAGLSAAHADDERGHRLDVVFGYEAAGLGADFAVVEGNAIVTAAGATFKAGVPFGGHVMENTAIVLRVGALRFAHGIECCLPAVEASVKQPALPQCLA